MIIMIYVNCLYYLGYHICNKQKKYRIRDLCRVQKPWHTANEPIFAVCQSQGTRQIFELCRVPRRQAHGKGGRHVTSQVSVFFCRGSALAHGKYFAVCSINGTWQRTPLPMSECRVLFAVCGTRQSLCRVHIGLCRVLLAHGKAAVSRSDYGINIQ